MLLNEIALGLSLAAFTQNLREAGLIKKNVSYCPVIKCFSMTNDRPYARFISRLLIAAMLLQLSLPSWTAFAGVANAGWVEICATGGVQWIKAAGSDAAPALPDHASSDHCLLCAVTGAAGEFDVRNYLLAQVRAALGQFFGTSPASVFAGHSIRSRAPPSLF